jgi:hypothetical protein
MIDKNDTIQLLGISNEIIGLFGDKDEMPNTDFQGCLEAQIMKAYLLGKKGVTKE